MGNKVRKEEVPHVCDLGGVPVGHYIYTRGAAVCASAPIAHRLASVLSRRHRHEAIYHRDLKRIIVSERCGDRPWDLGTGDATTPPEPPRGPGGWLAGAVKGCIAPRTGRGR